MKLLLAALTMTLSASASFAGVTSLDCKSANGRLSINFADELAVGEYIEVDQQLASVSRDGKPVQGVTVILNKAITTAIDFVVFEPSDAQQNFHLEVKAAKYELSKLLEGNKKIVLESGKMNCRLDNP